MLVAQLGSFLVGLEEHVDHTGEDIRNAFSVKKVSASHSRGEADIISEEPIDEAKLREAITKTGYDFVSMTSKPYEKHGLFGFLKK